MNYFGDTNITVNNVLTGNINVEIEGMDLIGGVTLQGVMY